MGVIDAGDARYVSGGAIPFQPIYRPASMTLPVASRTTMWDTNGNGFIDAGDLRTTVLDTNRNGVIDAGDARYVSGGAIPFQPIYRPGSMTLPVASRTTTTDTNGNGFIDAYDTRTQVLDTNGNGFIGDVGDTRITTSTM